jgi:hypothetical protein
MSLDYRVAGRSVVSTGALADNVGCALWNPHATMDLTVDEIHFFNTVATVSNPGVVRTTTRGTAVTTVTPDIDNHALRLLDRITGAVLDVDYSADPTVSGPYLARYNLPAVIGSGLMLSFAPRGIRVPAGTGLALASPVAVATTSMDVTYVWHE